MGSIIDFISEYLYVYLWLIVTTFINVVAPMAGSVVVNPVTAFFTDPQRAIGISALIFVCTGIHRVYLFRKEIVLDRKNLEVVKTMLPYSVLGAIAGGFLISYLNAHVLALCIVVASLYFICKTLRQLSRTGEITVHPTKTHRHALVSLLSGFLQGGGMPGSDIRNNYLRTVLSEVSVRAVSSVIGIVIFFITGSIIFFHNHLTHTDLIFIVSIIPFLIPAQLYGKRFLDKMNDRNAKLLAIAFSLIGVILLGYKYLL